MDFINEENRTAGQLRADLGRVLHHLAYLLDARSDRAERDELRRRAVGDDSGERGLTGAGRPPEDQRGQTVFINQAPQYPSLGEQMILPDEFIERARAHPLGERRRRRRIAVEWFAR